MFIYIEYFNYCCTIWSNIKNKGYFDKLYRLQKRAAILNEKDRYTPTSVLFGELTARLLYFKIIDFSF